MIISKNIRVSDILASLSFTILGIFIIYEVRSFTLLGAVFPKYVSYIMIISSLSYILISIFIGSGKKIVLKGNNRKRILIFLIMLGWAFSINYIGFLLSSLIFYSLSILVSNHERFDIKKTLINILIGIALVIFIYFIFNNILNVPLPTAKIF